VVAAGNDGVNNDINGNDFPPAVCAQGVQNIPNQGSLPVPSRRNEKDAGAFNEIFAQLRAFPLPVPKIGAGNNLPKDKGIIH
jgi:hypothetical protein